MKKKFGMRIAASAAAVLFTAGTLLTAGAGLPQSQAEKLGVIEAQAARPLAITSCTVQGDQVVMNISGSLGSDDGKIYVYADEVNQDGPTGTIVATAAKGTSSVSFPLNLNSASSNLSKKFLIAVKRGGSMVQASDEHYITNPEAISTVAAGRMDHGIKGLMPDQEKIGTNELADLGIKQVNFNMYLGNIVGPTRNEFYPTINYNYDGQVWQFDGAIVNLYDEFVTRMNSQGIQVTMTIVNDLQATSMDLIHPLSRDKLTMDCPCYAFNTVEDAGVQHLKAIAAFIGQRYNGADGHGQIDNWVIGNENNARSECFYMSNTDLDFNVNAYAKAFRIFYNGIKSMSATSRIYISMDQEWKRKSNPGCFLSSEYMDLFNHYMQREGNIDWSLSIHPYNAPLFDPYAWQGQAQYVKNSLDSEYITMQNIDQLTALMHTPAYLNPAGEVRSISIAEIGYTSSFGENLQAASVVYGYLKAAHNPDIDAFILYRETDNAKEILTNIAQGITNPDGSHKPAYDFYKNIDGPQADVYKQKASAIIGQDVQAMVNNGVFLTR